MLAPEQKRSLVHWLITNGLVDLVNAVSYAPYGMLMLRNPVAAFDPTRERDTV